MPFNYGDDTGFYVLGGWQLKRIAIAGCRGSDCHASRPVYSLEGQRGELGFRVWHRPACVCVWCFSVGAEPVVESPSSCRDATGSICGACMAPPTKRRRSRSSCCQRLAEPVAERTAAGGGGEVFALRQGGGVRQAQKDLKSRRGAHTAIRQCRWRSELL